MIDIVDDGRVRTITFQRPEAKNAMNTEMWDGTAEAFLAAADDPGVAVVVLTGSEDSFSAGQDLIEMAQLATGNGPEQKHGFAGLPGLARCRDAWRAPHDCWMRDGAFPRARPPRCIRNRPLTGLGQQACNLGGETRAGSLDVDNSPLRRISRPTAA